MSVPDGDRSGGAFAARALAARDAYNRVLARAVARPAKLLELVRPLMREGSILLLLTSSELAESLQRPPAGFALRPVTPQARVPSAIVALERSSRAEAREET